MKLSTTESINLANLMLNDLEHSRWFLLEAYSQREELDVNSDLVTKAAGRTMELGIAKAVMLDKLLAKGGMPNPDQDGLELIEFWLNLDQATREDEADDT